MIGDETIYLEYLQIKSEWENLLAKKTDGIIMRSKAQWVESGEKNTKYFLNLEKRNHNNTCIKKLILDDNSELVDIKPIIQEQERFYKNLFTSKSNIENTERFLNNENIKTLDKADRDLCENNLTVEEISIALSKLPNGRSPGPDGLTTDFYKFFWSDIQDLLLSSYLYSLENKSLSQFQKRAILNLIPKRIKT